MVDAPTLTDDKAGLGANELGGLDGIVGFHIRLAHATVYRHFTETFAHLDLTQKQVSTLWLVSAFPGMSQIALGQRLRMDRATTMTIVNRLQERDYLRRERAASDARKQALYLTEAGVAVLAESKSANAEHAAWLRSRFTPQEAEKLVEMLARIHE